MPFLVLSGFFKRSRSSDFLSGMELPFFSENDGDKKAADFSHDANGQRSVFGIGFWMSQTANHKLSVHEPFGHQQFKDFCFSLKHNLTVRGLRHIAILSYRSSGIDKF